MDRRTFIRLTAGSLACGAAGIPRIARAESLDSDYVPFSPDIAAEAASGFFAEVGSLTSFDCSNPIPVFDADGKLVGYEVSAVDYSDYSLGYLVFDVRCPGLISRFSIGEGRLGPYELITGMNESISYQSADAPMLSSSSPLSFVVPLPSEGVSLMTNGETTELPSGISAYSGAGNSTYDPTTWTDLMIRWSEVLRGPYSLGGHNGMEVNGLSLSESVSSLGKYACAVTALYSIASTMTNAARTDWLIDRYNDINCYDTIWEYTDTAVEKIERGVTYGTTQHQNIGPGFQRFCAERGVSILPVRVASPSLSKFQNQVDALRHSVVMLAINVGPASSPQREGHAMAVSGYGRISKGSTTLNCIVVYDGWSDEAFINYEFPGFMDKNGVFM